MFHNDTFLYGSGGSVQSPGLKYSVIESIHEDSRSPAQDVVLFESEVNYTVSDGNATLTSVLPSTDGELPVGQWAIVMISLLFCVIGVLGVIGNSLMILSFSDQGPSLYVRICLCRRQILTYRTIVIRQNLTSVGVRF